MQHFFGLFSSCEALGTVTIPESVTSIGREAFSACLGLSEIRLPASLAYIGERAFLSCSALETIAFAGTKVLWEAVGKESGWNTDTGLYSVVCADGEIPKW